MFILNWFDILISIDHIKNNIINSFQSEFSLSLKYYGYFILVEKRILNSQSYYIVFIHYNIVSTFILFLYKTITCKRLVISYYINLCHFVQRCNWVQV